MELPWGAQQEMSRGSSPSELFCAAVDGAARPDARHPAEHTASERGCSGYSANKSCAARLAPPQRKKREGKERGSARF